MNFKVRNYEFSDDRAWAWVDIDVEDDPNHPAALARFSFAVNVDPGHSVREIDKSAFEELRRFASEIARELGYLRSLH